MNIKQVILVLGMQIQILNAQAQYNPFFQIYGGANEVAILSMDTVTDGGYILNAVDQNSGGSDFLIIKTDVNGNEEWRYHNNQFDGLDSSNVLFTIKEASDKGYLGCGNINRSYLPGNYTDVLLTKLDSLGNLEWKRTFDFDYYDELNSAFRNNEDSTWIVAGWSTALNSIMKIKNNGDTLWTKKIPNPILSNLFRVDFIKKVNSEYYFVGKCDSILGNLVYSRILKTDSLGSLIWQKNYRDTSSIKGSSYWFTSDSTFLINSYMQSPNSLYYSRQLEIDILGTVIDTVFTPGYGVYDSDSTVMYANSGQVNFDSLYIGRINYYSGEIRNFSSLFVPDCAIYGIAADSYRNILVCGSQDVFGKVGILIKAVDTLLSVTSPEISNDNHFSLSVFPNPTSEWLHFSIRGMGSYNLSLFNPLGNEIVSYQNIRLSYFTLNVKALPKGFYYYSIDNGQQKTVSGKIIIN